MNTDVKTPLVSIVVPVYNAEKYLDECILSIVNQTYQNLEIILVDDGSPDNCPAICDNWAEKDNRIKVIHKKNGGPSDARNNGISYSKGVFITFIDSDDIVSSFLIEKLVNIAVNVPSSDLVAAKISRFQKTPNIETLSSCSALKLKNKDLCGIRQGYFTPAVLFNRNLLLSIGLKFDIRLKNLEDVIFNGIYLIYTTNVHYIPEALYYYRDTPNSITKSATNVLYQVKCWYSARNAISNWFAKNFTTKCQVKEYRQLYRHCQNNLHAEANVGQITFIQFSQMQHDAQCIHLEDNPPFSIFEAVLLKVPKLYYKSYIKLFQFINFLRK